MINNQILLDISENLSEVSVGCLRKKLGLSSQRPTHRAIQRDELAVFRWMAMDYKEIQNLAKQHNAEIYFVDESCVRSDYHSGTAWAPKGQTLVVKTTAIRHKVNLVSAINARGFMRFTAVEET